MPCAHSGNRPSRWSDASADPDVLRQIVDEGANARREMPALADEDRVDRLGVAGIERLQHGFELAGLDVRADMEHRQPRDPDAGQRQLPCRLTVADLDIAGGGKAPDLAPFAERPAVADPLEV